MARMVEPDGAMAACARPFRPPSYAPDRVPDAMLCAGAVITINDSRDGQPRPSLAVSNGASWDRYVRCDEVDSLVRKLVAELLKTPPNIDLTPLVRDEVRAIVPSLVERVAKPQLPAPTMHQNAPAVAQGLLELAEAIGALQERVDHVEHEVATINGTEVLDPSSTQTKLQQLAGTVGSTDAMVRQLSATVDEMRQAIGRAA